MVGSSFSTSQIMPSRIFDLFVFLGYFAQDKINFGETGCLVPLVPLFVYFSVSMVKSTETA